MKKFIFGIDLVYSFFLKRIIKNAIMAEAFLIITSISTRLK
ncbi:hypothetical protein ABIE01_000056 [Lactococcus lactis]